MFVGVSVSVSVCVSMCPLVLNKKYIITKKNCRGEIRLKNLISSFKRNYKFTKICLKIEKKIITQNY